MSRTKYEDISNRNGNLKVEYRQKHICMGEKESIDKPQKRWYDDRTEAEIGTE